MPLLAPVSFMNGRLKWLLLLACLFGRSTTLLVADTPQVVNCDGYPCVNFSLGANVSTNGEIFGSLFFNRPQLGEGLDPIGGGRFSFRVGENAWLHAVDCARREVERNWPFAVVGLTDERLDDVAIRCQVVVPNALDDSFTGSLSVGLAEFSVTNSSGGVRQVAVRFDAPGFLKTEPQLMDTNSVCGLEAGRNFFCWLKPAHVISSNACSSLTVTLQAGASTKLRMMIGHWEDNWPYSSRLANPIQLADFAAREWDTLVEATRRLEAKIPRTGDQELDTYMRWYATAGASMTRVLKDGTTLTMGYHELNQRDSYWTTWMHLVLWPSLEKRMIRESGWGQRPDGKVPTTILPVIERENDIDINCYFILRALRYVRFHHDAEFGRMIHAKLLQAAAWLNSRDLEGVGLPQAASYWYDWKDVSGVSNRKYSPYASMLYIAATRRLADFSAELGEYDVANTLQQRSDRAREFLMRPVSQGGMWNGRFFQQVWRDGRQAPQVLEDQVVGILFDVVNQQQARSILEALQGNLTRWGYRETFPYHPPEFGYHGGDYHNGGIWPWLNHVHAWGLLKLGDSAAAREVLKRVGRADLVTAGDFIPHEYLDGETGKQAGVPMQGWNAAMFGALYFGLQNRGAIP